MSTKSKPPAFDFTNYPGLSDPNWTQVPDEVLDFMLPSLSGAELKVFLYIIRRTFGFKRDADRITLYQLCDGLRRVDGLPLDYGTGLSRRAVIAAVKALEEKGLVQVVRGTTKEGTTDVNVYRVRQAADARVQKSNPEGAESAPPRVQKSNPLKEVVRKTERRKTEQQQQERLPEPPSDPTSSGDPCGPVVVASHPQTARRPTVNAIMVRLSALGVAYSTAQRLLEQFSEEHVYRWVCYVEAKLAGGWVPRETPAAWIVSAIQSRDWVIPDWFRTPEEEAALDAKRSQEAEAEQRQREAEAEAERAQQEAQRRAIEKELGIGEATRVIWERTKELLQERKLMSPALYTAYLLPLRGSVAVIATPIEFFCSVILSRADAIKEALRDASGREVEQVEVRYVETSSEAPRESRGRSAALKGKRGEGG